MIKDFEELKKAVDSARYGAIIYIDKENNFKEAPEEERHELLEILNNCQMSLEYAN